MGEPKVVMMMADELEALLRRVVNETRASASADEVLGMTAVCALLDTNHTTVLSWIRTKGLPCSQVGRDRKFLRSAVLAWLVAQGEAGGGNVTKITRAIKRAKG